MSLIYLNSNFKLFKLTNTFSPCANSFAPSSPNELPLKILLLKNIFSKRFYKKFLRFIFSLFLCFRKVSLFYLKTNVRLFKLTNTFSTCANSLAPSSPIELLLKILLLKNILSKDFMWNFFALFFSLFLCFLKVSLFYSNSNVKLFKLTNTFSPCANSLAPSFPI